MCRYAALVKRGDSAEIESEFFEDRDGLPRLLSLPFIGQEVAPGL
jgi:hypothetical protein